MHEFARQAIDGTTYRVRSTRNLERSAPPTLGHYSSAYITWEGVSVVARSIDRQTCRALLDLDFKAEWNETYTLGDGTAHAGTYTESNENHDPETMGAPLAPQNLCYWETSAAGVWVESEVRSTDFLLDLLDAGKPTASTGTVALPGVSKSFDENGSRLILTLFDRALAELTPIAARPPARGAPAGLQTPAGKVMREVGDGRDPAVVLRSETAFMRLSNAFKSEDDISTLAVDEITAVTMEAAE